MIFAGIDYSMTSPAICIGGRGDSMNGCKFFGVGSGKKVGVKENVTIMEYPLWNTSQERFDRISSMFVDILIEQEVDTVFIEGYAFGATGKVFDIQENTGILKHKMYKQRFPYETLQPTQVKKFQTGKGNQNKEGMYAAWLGEGGLDINGWYSKSQNIGSPASDIVDAYYVMKLGISLS